MEGLEQRSKALSNLMVGMLKEIHNQLSNFTTY